MTDGAAPSPGRAWWAAGALIALHVALAWYCREPSVATGEDPAKYISLANELRSFSYRDVSYAGAPWHYRYPPGYPALLALASLVSSSFNWFLFISVACSAVALGVVFTAVARIWDARLALLLLAALAVNPALVGVAGSLSAEAPFMLCIALTMWATTRDTLRARWAAGASGIAAFVTRSAGIVSVPALVVVWSWRRQWRTVAAFGVAATLVAGAWQLHALTAPQQYVGDSYAADFVRGGTGDVSDSERPGIVETLGRRVWANSQWYLSRGIPLRVALPAFPGTPLDNLAHLLILVIGLGAGIAVFARRWPAVAAFMLFYGGLLAVWPWQVPRFIMPVIPWLVLGVLVGIGATAGRIRPTLGPRVIALLAIVLIVTGGARTAEFAGRSAACDRAGGASGIGCLSPEQERYLRMVSFIRDSTPPGAIVLSAKPATVYHFSGRQAIPHQEATAVPPERFIEFLRARPVRYILLGSVHSTEVLGFRRNIELNCAALTLRKAAAPHAYLFELNETPAPDNAACRAVTLHTRANEGQLFEVPW